jgi:hypothetical protein
MGKANVMRRGNVDDDSIVDGSECCRICRERYPEIPEKDILRQVPLERYPEKNT